MKDDRLHIFAVTHFWFSRHGSANVGRISRSLNAKIYKRRFSCLEFAARTMVLTKDKTTNEPKEYVEMN
jgi:hypothetical protein